MRTMIKIAFMTAQRKIIRFEVENRIVRYFDNNWPDGIQIMPSQTPEMKKMLRKMLISRKPAIMQTALLIVDANSGKNKEDYEKCENDEEIAENIKKDCLLKGLVEVK